MSNLVENTDQFRLVPVALQNLVALALSKEVWRLAPSGNSSFFLSPFLFA